MLLALVLCFDHRKTRDVVNIFDLKSSKGHKYIWYALPGYAIGLVAALAAGVLTHSPQPALLYLVIISRSFELLCSCGLTSKVHNLHVSALVLTESFVDRTFLVSI